MCLAWKVFDRWTISLTNIIKGIALDEKIDTTLSTLNMKLEQACDWLGLA